MKNNITYLVFVVLLSGCITTEVLNKKELVDKQSEMIPGSTFTIVDPFIIEASLIKENLVVTKGESGVKERRGKEVASETIRFLREAIVAHLEERNFEHVTGKSDFIVTYGFDIKSENIFGKKETVAHLSVSLNDSSQLLYYVYGSYQVNERLDKRAAESVMGDLLSGLKKNL